jgi:hypothetical protein
VVALPELVSAERLEVFGGSPPESLPTRLISFPHYPICRVSCLVFAKLLLNSKNAFRKAFSKPIRVLTALATVDLARRPSIIHEAEDDVMPGIPNRRSADKRRPEHAADETTD